MPVVALVSLTYTVIYTALAYVFPAYQTFKVRQEAAASGW
jgi:hypothetical protein